MSQRSDRVRRRSEFEVSESSEPNEATGRRGRDRTRATVGGKKPKFQTLVKKESDQLKDVSASANDWSNPNIFADDTEYRNLIIPVSPIRKAKVFTPPPPAGVLSLGGVDAGIGSISIESIRRVIQEAVNPLYEEINSLKQQQSLILACLQEKGFGKKEALPDQDHRKMHPEVDLDDPRREKHPTMMSNLVKCFVHEHCIAFNIFINDNDLLSKFEEYVKNLQRMYLSGNSGVLGNIIPSGAKDDKYKLEMAEAITYFMDDTKKEHINAYVLRRRDNMLSSIGASYKKEFVPQLMAYFPKEFSSCFENFREWPSDGSGKKKGDEDGNSKKWFASVSKDLELFANRILECGPRKVFGSNAWERFHKRHYEKGIDQKVLERQIESGYIEAWGLLYILETLRGNLRISRKGSSSVDLKLKYGAIGARVMADRKWDEEEKKRIESEKDVDADSDDNEKEKSSGEGKDPEALESDDDSLKQSDRNTREDGTFKFDE